jgi:hypothetical protein
LQKKTKKQQDLAKNIDIDGNGNIDEDEKKILDTLREMDVDGDGNISLKVGLAVYKYKLNPVGPIA